MPVLELHVLEGYTDEEKGRLGRALTDAVRIVVPAPPEAVTVMIHEMPHAAYMRGREHRNGARALPDPVEIIRGFLGAMEARNLKQAQALLGPDFTMNFPGAPELHSLAALIEWAAPRYRFVKKTYEGFDALHSPQAHAIVYCRGTLSGEWPDGTPFEGIRFIDRFEVTAGLLTRQDVWNDIAEHKGKT
ncbi:tautomerase family protein [Sulfitobacter guttiformis]|uniref:4-oxalocrotonate tautomerase family enzyme n=1 Tax=Sulfitobacter guttiformis TaxID=74349 RepID=A0A420DTQ8_9RHOB|nr:tautomerase family protein [Sulfitobacter guttiformis]KIN71045.1 putative tautomerase [Sulfitobacter guttiformis KCTC 32187]RKE97529.1 4-oxalocrotonate tautomerase family enzyme [Sulfitobacter guttiformis]